MCVCHPWKRPKNVLLGDEEWQKKIKKENIVQPPVSDHPKCKGLVVAYGRWSLMRLGPQRRNFLVDLEWSGIFMPKKIMKV